WAANGRREVYLSGQAYFQVTKNKELPFVVYSRFISTTALGTAFRVTNVDNGQPLQVRLVEGKVRVELIDSSSAKTAPAYYLVPGQEIVFTNPQQPGRIHAFKKPAIPKGTKMNTALATAAADATYMFNNQTLAEVLDHLSVIYQQRIVYAREDIGQMYFIGKIETTDPIEKTLQDIALLNKLSVKKQGGVYILKRKKQ
ncbi:MAG TPA: FecR domain-containing protein, partial [Chitinophagaceae bacterium]|nr:FecR domain-containing protein [Chitinophagaceae bacterium]